MSVRHPGGLTEEEPPELIIPLGAYQLQYIVIDI